MPRRTFCDCKKKKVERGNEMTWRREEDMIESKKSVTQGNAKLHTAAAAASTWKGNDRSSSEKEMTDREDRCCSFFLRD